jgi:UDP-N-acetylmuramoylalanine--D-glutamate ligase
MSGRFVGERAVVLGLGVAGAAAARVLAEEGASVLVSEAAEQVDPVAAGDLGVLGVEIRTGGHVPEHLDGATLVVTSPGIPEGAAVLGWAHKARLPVWSEIELGAQLATAPYAAVTGTNGKTTTTKMLEAAMRAAGLDDALACGNVGYPFSLAARERHAALAVEVSSFQLRFHESFHPRTSVLLNLAPDHLDWHGTVDAYIEAKARVFANQEGADVHVGNLDDARSAEVSRQARCEVRWFTLGEPGEGAVGFVGDELVSRLDREVRLGVPVHGAASHRADAAAAAASAIAFGLEPAPVGRAVCAFRPMEHRGGVIATVDGVAFVDDSKATNPHAALAAVDGMRDVVLIAGGRSKGVDLSPLARLAPSLTAVVAIGEAAGELEALFRGLVPFERAGSMEEAVTRAAARAVAGGSVVLAPACASQDMFRDYADRGERFARAVTRVADQDRRTRAG